VYALTRGTTHGWGTPETLSLLGASIALIAGFIVVEVRSPWPLLPLRIFRSRSVSVANVAMAIVGGVAFSEFFVLALYLQEVLHYSAVQSGVAFVGFALTVVVVSNIAQIVVGRAGVRTTLTAGLLMSAASVAYLTRLPVDGHYFWDVFPAFVLGGAGMGLSFVPVTIASLAGVHRADAGIASGLVNTSRQIGGAIGIAATTAIASTSTAHFGGAPAGSADALDHGYQTALYVLTGLLVVGSVLTAALLRTAGPAPVTELRPSESRPVSEAA
jgi:predicted MFS family arabinose efflux permease